MASPASSALIGKTIDGKVKLLSVIGEGGMGAVYRGRQIVLDRDVALKLLKPQYLTSEDLVRRFYHEAKSAASLRSRHVIGVLDFGRAPEGAYIIMELSGGTPLAEILYKYGALAPSRAISIAAQILSGLAEAHAKGIIHRDLKSENILIERDYADKDFAMILDFGIAKLASSSSVQTAIGAIFGTPSYMSPEQCQGVAADARSDLYSLGIILYEMLTGDTPYGDRLPAQLLVAHIKEPPTPILVRNPSIPPLLAELVMTLLIKDREQRPRDAEAVRKALLAAVTLAPSPMGLSQMDSTMLEIPTRVDRPADLDLGELDLGDQDQAKTLPPSGAHLSVDLDLRPERVPTLVGSVTKAVTMTKDEWRVVAQLGEGRTLKEVAETLGVPLEVAIPVVRTLVLRGLIRLRDRSSDAHTMVP